MSEEELAGFDQEQADEAFRRQMRQVLEGWMELAAERLLGSGIPMTIMPGNDDVYEIDEVLNASGYCQNTDGKVVRLGPFELLSLGHANETPWQCPRDLSEEELAAKIEALAAQVEDMGRSIWNIHVPPYDSGLDTAPELDSNFKPVTHGGQMHEIPVGSHAVRGAIERHQPLLSLHGHIHESRSVAKIGRTTCINPGSEYQSGLLRGVYIAINEKGEVKHAFTAG
jgi:Icc-related predicted phosphoesterase